jgi:predicted RNA-binding Zn ribbon-like protein
MNLPARTMPDPQSPPASQLIPSTDYVFDLDGGRACLDFANTDSSSGDHLGSYADLVAFAAQSDLLTPDDAEWLRAEGGRDHAIADGVLVRAKRLRTAMRNIFFKLADGEEPTARDLGVLNFDLAASLSHARVLPSGKGAYTWGWAGRNLDAPIWPITRSAADLLTSDSERRLVRECGADDCKWLFLDTSKNRSRQWCSMQSCGNRQKARRHYQRLRQIRGDASGAEAAPGRGRRKTGAAVEGSTSQS